MPIQPPNLNSNVDAQLREYLRLLADTLNLIESRLNILMQENLKLSNELKQLRDIIEK